MSSKLIVLRGPSGAGKTTVATLLHERAINKTALFDQDYYRHVMFNNPHTDLEAPRFVMFAAVKAALQHGYDVIIEGFMGMGKYKPYFDELLTHHPTGNYFFYMDVAFNETIRRHQTRHKAKPFSETHMRELYAKTSPSGYSDEVTILESASAEDAYQLIVKTVGIPVSDNT